MLSRNREESEQGIRLCGRKCVICGWNKRDYKDHLLVEGAHVRKVDNIKDYDCHDNIIALCPNHHTEFDRGNITIDPDNKICLHINPNDEVHKQKITGKINHIQPGYFHYHRKHTFKGEK